MSQIIPNNFRAISNYIPSELICVFLILAYLGLYLLGLYFSSKPKVSFLKSVGLTSFSIGMIIFTLTGMNIFMGVIVALSHILIAVIIRKTSGS